MATVSPQFIIEGLKRRGYPEHVAQGFVMNMMDESGLNPGINEAAPIVPGSRGGFGLYQLTGPRRTAYEQFAAQRGVNPADAEAQLDFLDYELKGPESRAAKSILSTQNPQQAAVAIARDFLRPATEHLQNRVARYSGADVAADTMAVLGKGGGTVNPDQIAQGAMAQSAGQEPEQPRGLLGNLFGNPDTMAALAMAFNSMRLTPDPNLAQVLSAQMKERRTERKDKAQRNSTAEWLRSMKMEDLARAVETGALTGAQAVSLAKTGSSKDGTAAMKNYAEYNRILKEQGPEAAAQFLRMTGGQDINIDLNKGELSPGWKKIDEKFAETYNEWNTTGATDALKQSAQLRGVLADLRAGKNLTGPVLGLQPDVIQSFLNPDALDARQKVEEVVQRNLRKILGAQFTKEEGERLISRSFDQRLSPEQNAARLEALLNQMDAAAQNTANMVKYFNENGTLRGYEGNQFSSSIASFDQMFDALDQRQGLAGGNAQGGGQQQSVSGDGSMAKPFKITPQTKPSDIPSGSYFLDPNGILRRKP